MIINADSLLPHLKEKVRPTHSDGSRHLLCPDCGIRTKLNTLGDGRRKCSTCGKKFRIHKVTDGNKLQQCADILLCFCLDFSAHRAAQITHHRYRLVATHYHQFRKLLTENTLSKEKIQLLSEHKGDIQVIHKKTRCRWCRSTIRGTTKVQLPVFGVQLQTGGGVTIDPLRDDEVPVLGPKQSPQGLPEGYIGFICCGKLHRFTKLEGVKDSAEHLWMWILERVRARHGIWKRNTGYYLKELEWKYNNRSIDPDLQGQKLIEFMPADFLTVWMEKEVL